jgi:hypothetical protein
MNEKGTHPEGVPESRFSISTTEDLGAFGSNRESHTKVADDLNSSFL